MFRVKQDEVIQKTPLLPVVEPVNPQERTPLVPKQPKKPSAPKNPTVPKDNVYDTLEIPIIFRAFKQNDIWMLPRDKLIVDSNSGDHVRTDMGNVFNHLNTGSSPYYVELDPSTGIPGMYRSKDTVILECLYKGEDLLSNEYKMMCVPYYTKEYSFAYKNKPIPKEITTFQSIDIAISYNRFITNHGYVNTSNFLFDKTSVVPQESDTNLSTWGKITILSIPYEHVSIGPAMRRLHIRVNGLHEEFRQFIIVERNIRFGY